MVSRDLVPMRERIAGPRGTGKPLQIAVDGVPGTTGGDADQCRDLSVGHHASSFNYEFTSAFSGTAGSCPDLPLAQPGHE
jgi:hypothetical protein